VIDERQEEQASLYVLGALSADEAAAFEAALRRDPELEKLVARLRDTAGALAGTVPHVNPPPALKQRILDEIDRREKVVPLTQPVSPKRSPIAWIPWALAACFAIICAVLVSNESGTRARVTELTVLADTLQKQTNALALEVADLRQKAELASLRIAMLDSQLTNAPKAAAVALWNEKDQTGVLVVKNLKQLPADKDYELWVFDGSRPVAAGLVPVDADGNLRIPFKAHARIQSAGTFAVTEEPKGGGEIPRGQPVLAGGSL
jgi:anti-sigma-K factor RskA